MKALVKAKAEPGLWLEDVPEPAVGINDILIKVLKTGICGTDLHIYNWDAWAQKTIPVPMVVGHEFVGEIVEVAVRDAKAGDPVARSWVAKLVLGASPPRLSCLDADEAMEALLADLYSRLQSPGAS